MTPDS